MNYCTETGHIVADLNSSFPKSTGPSSKPTVPIDPTIHTQSAPVDPQMAHGVGRVIIENPFNLIIE